VAVVRGRHADYRHAHPARAALILEVAESSLAFDRVQKGSLYARAGVADYWIVNLVDSVVELYRNPAPDLTAPFGWRYSSVERFRPPATLTLLELPQAAVPVAALLP
jgi:Uma2 family endonuclease